MIQCGKHGLQEIEFTSPYIQGLILSNGTVDEEVFPVRIYLEILDKYAYFWSNLQFINDIGFHCESTPKSLSLDSIGEEESFEVYAKTVPVCGKCHAEFLHRNNLSYPKEAYTIISGS